MKQIVTLLCVSLLSLSVPLLTYATDCATSFDQRCLAGGYNATQVEANYQASQARMAQQFQEEQARIERAQKAYQAALDAQRNARAEMRKEIEMRQREDLIDATRSQAAGTWSIVEELRR